jgi:hypothetical protein
MASLITLKNNENPGRAGVGMPVGILPTTAKLNFWSSLANFDISVPKMIFKIKKFNGRIVMLSFFFGSFSVQTYHNQLNGNGCISQLFSETFVDVYAHDDQKRHHNHRDYHGAPVYERYVAGQFKVGLEINLFFDSQLNLNLLIPESITYVNQLENAYSFSASVNSENMLHLCRQHMERSSGCKSNSLIVLQIKKL